jgi:uroporphyrinogen-III synthase
MNEIIVLTSAAGTFPGLLEALRENAISVAERPLLRFEPPLDWTPVDAALEDLSRYTSIAFTSPRAARAFADRLELRGKRRSHASGEPEIWAVGAGTAAALGGRVGPVRLPAQGGDAGARALAHAMLQAGTAGPVLFPCGETRRHELASELRQSGIQVDEVVCYRSILADEAEARAAVAQCGVIVVASPRVADLLARTCPPGSRPGLLAVGPMTAASARAAGWSPDAIASDPSPGALVSAITELLVKH